MNKGKIEQIAAPQDLYQRPATEYVATFIGLTNRLPGASNGDGPWSSLEELKNAHGHDHGNHGQGERVLDAFKYVLVE